MPLGIPFSTYFFIHYPLPPTATNAVVFYLLLPFARARTNKYTQIVKYGYKTLDNIRRFSYNTIVWFIFAKLSVYF